MQQRNAKGQFIKGLVPWNKGKRGYMGANATSFTPETVKKPEYYTPRTVARRGDIMATLEQTEIKKDGRTGKFYRYHKRTSYARAVMIKAGYIIPKGAIVYHKDQDPTNNSLDNLEIITRAELAKRNNTKGQKKWTNKN